MKYRQQAHRTDDQGSKKNARHDPDGAVGADRCFVSAGAEVRKGQRQHQRGKAEADRQGRQCADNAVFPGNGNRSGSPGGIRKSAEG